MQCLNSASFIRIIFMHFHIIALKVKFSMRRKNSHAESIMEESYEMCIRDRHKGVWKKVSFQKVSVKMKTETQTPYTDQVQTDDQAQTDN